MILTLGLALALAAAEPPNFKALIRDLDNADRAAAALDKLVEAKGAAIPALAAEAQDGRSLGTRGWAIVGLARIGDKDAQAEIKKVYDDAKNPPLVRSWALAAQVDACQTLDCLTSLTQEFAQHPEMTRPISMRLAAVATKGNADPAQLLDRLITLLQTNWTLQQPIAELVATFPPKALVEIMVKSPNQNTRYYAASYAATAAQKDPRAMARAVIAIFKFDPKATGVPWQGGPLYVPSMTYEKQEAGEIFGELIAWMIFASHVGSVDAANQLNNNLPNFIPFLGIPQPNWGDRSVTVWLKIYAQARGPGAVKKLLDEQPEAAKPYRSIVFE